MTDPREALAQLLSEPDLVRLVVEQLPGDVLAAVERTAQRLGLQAEFDQAMAGVRG